MSDLVPADDIERIVGVARHAIQHFARYVNVEQTVYIMHSQKCKDWTPDLRECPYSMALDRGIDVADWVGFEDRPVVVAIINGRLFPVVPAWLGGQS